MTKKELIANLSHMTDDELVYLVLPGDETLTTNIRAERYDLDPESETPAFLVLTFKE